MAKSNVLLLAAIILGVTLAGWLGFGAPAAAQDQASPDSRRGEAQARSEGASAPAVDAQSPDAARLLQKAEDQGSIRAIVGLRTGFVPEGRLSGAQSTDQRDAIDGATSALQSELSGTGYETLREYETVPYVALELTPEAFREVQESSRVSTIQEDVAVPADLAESTRIVQAPTMWANPTGGVFRYTGFGKTVAVLDTGVDGNHPFLAGKVVEEACFSGNSNCPNGTTTQTGAGAGAPCTYAASGCQHGTHVAGIAAGDGTNFDGVARGADIFAVQVFSRFTGAQCNGAGEDPCTLSFVSDQLAGLEHVYDEAIAQDDLTVSAANMSLGGGAYTSTCDSDSRKAAIDNLRSISAATVISSGNDGFINATGAPGCISSAITVGSTTKQDTLSPFSNAASWVDLLAPGSSINSSVPGSGFAVFDGTSMAAPHVAGAWALLEHWDAGQTVLSLTDRLQNTGTPVQDPGGPVTTRRINIADAAGQRPPGDLFGSPRPIGGAALAVNGFNGAATREFAEPDHWSGATLGENSVWHSWRAPSSGQVTLDTCTSSFDTVLAVYTGGSVGALTRVASDDDSCDAPNAAGSRLTFNATSGNTYRIAVAGYQADTRGEGTFTLRLRDIRPPRVSGVAPADLATGIAPSTNAIAVFSEAMNPNLVNSSTFTLRRAGTTANVAAAVSYDAAAKRATLNPNANLQPGATYIATVTPQARDLAGNSLDQDPGAAGAQAKIWRFTVRR